MNESMTKLQTVYLSSGSQSTVVFSNIPQNYTDLVVKISSRTDRTSSYNDYVNVSFNGTTTGYNAKFLQGTGSSLSSYTETSASAPRYVTDTAGNSGGTANAFGNAEMFIPNYSGNAYKSYSVDGTTENNATAGITNMTAGLWSNTAPITSITFAPGVGTVFLQYTEFTLYGVKSFAKTVGNSIKASGGAITTDGTYVYHTFTSTGAFQPTTRLLADVFVLAGGAGGGAGNNTGGGGIAGGGGAGGAVYFASQQLISGTSYVATVGSGGSGASSSAANGGSGVNSQFASLTSAVGGGGGGGFDITYKNAISGGCGGGGATYSGAGTGGSSTQTGTGANAYYGNSGASGYEAGPSTAGGGGLGAASITPINTAATAGGIGLSSSTMPLLAGAQVGQFTNGLYYVGGGGGGAQRNKTDSYGFFGGYGGGGNGSVFGVANGNMNATANTGGGGGGGSGNATTGGAQVNGGNGGSGVIIVRYKA
jgi:hypothetical protein